jgi:hypothetical protein
MLLETFKLLVIYDASHLACVHEEVTVVFRFFHMPYLVLDCFVIEGPCIACNICTLIIATLLLRSASDKLY